MQYRVRVRSLAAATVLLAAVATQAVAGDAAKPSQVDRGRYLVHISGCNDCHTPGYMEAGQAPESQWLVGTPVGFQGPWGTTYASNLRLVVDRLTEEQWLVHARAQRLPPMPWFNLRAMTDADLKAIYAFVRSLGDPGKPAPAYVAPGGKVTTPYIVFVPQVDAEATAAR
jgi:mono/diheme cytochrome c family protein